MHKMGKVKIKSQNISTVFNANEWFWENICLLFIMLSWNWNCDKDVNFKYTQFSKDVAVFLEMVLKTAVS